MTPGNKRIVGIRPIDWENSWAKDYRLNGYPRLPNGQYADYGLDDYLVWLADYLAGNTLKPHPEQDPLVQRLCRSDPAVAMRLLGAHAGFDTVDCEDKPYYCYPANFDPQGDLSNLVARHPDDEPLGAEIYIDPIVQADFVARDFAYQVRYRREMDEFLEFWPDFTKVWDFTDETNGAVTEPPDAGWRLLLAAILYPVPDQRLKSTLLKIFFEAYDDETSG